MELDESVQDVVVREVLEETGYCVEVGGPLPVHHLSRSGAAAGRTKSVRVLFDATIAGGELGTLEVDGSTDFAERVRLDRLPDLTRETCLTGGTPGTPAGR